MKNTHIFNKKCIFYEKAIWQNPLGIWQWVALLRKALNYEFRLYICFIHKVNPPHRILRWFQKFITSFVLQLE